MGAELLSHWFLYSQDGLCVYTPVCMCVRWVRRLGSLQQGGKVISKLGGVGGGGWRGECSKEREVLDTVGKFRHLRSPGLRTALGSLVLGSPCWPVQKLQSDGLLPPLPPSCPVSTSVT